MVHILLIVLQVWSIGNAEKSNHTTELPQTTQVQVAPSGLAASSNTAALTAVALPQPRAAIDPNNSPKNNNKELRDDHDDHHHHYGYDTIKITEIN